MSIDILALARNRGREKQLPYAGAVTPQEAFDLLQQKPGASWWMSEPMPSATGWAE